MSELPKGWVGISISDVADVKGGKRLPKGGGFSEVRTSYPYIRVSDFDNGTVNTQKLKFIDRETHLAISNYVISSDDLYISIAGTIGLVGDIPKTLDGANLTENAAKLCNLHILNKDFLKYFLQSPSALQQFIDKTTSSGQPKLALFRIKDCSLGLAPLAEQKRIVEKLDEVLAQVDTIKARLDGIPAILKRFRQSVLASAVSGKLTSQDVSTQSSLVGDPWSHEVKAPSHWNLYEFKQAVKITGGSQPPKSEFKAEYEEGLVRLIQIRDYKSDKFLVYIPLDKAKRFCTEKDIMIGRYGPPIFQILRGISGAYNVALMKAEPAIDDLDLEYLYRFLQNPKLFHYIDAGSDRTAGQAGVNKKFLESYPLFVPPLEEQKEIVRLVDQYFAFADTIEKQVKKAQARVDNLTQSILAKAFRGELVAQDPNDEPADKLLERIAQARKEAEALAKAAKKAGATKKKVAKSA
ncbi:restriction endonuclease subunit S [Vibrio vulnificus]|nr:restriction endonuclease subunit S [Vibrio vulnificus]